MRAHLGAEPVLQRRDDAAAVGVVLGVRARDEQDVEGQPQCVSADLHVALFEHVEQRHLDALGQVGQLVHREDAAVEARHQPVVHGLGVAERAALGDLDRVDVADEVADAGVRSRQLLAVPLVAVQPVDRQVVAELLGEPAAAGADRRVGVVVDLAAVDDRRPLVEQAADRADQPGLALAALAEQHEVVAGEQRALDVGQHRLVEADDAGKPRLARPQPGEQVVADLDLDRFLDMAGGTKRAERRDQRPGGSSWRGVWGESGARVRPYVAIVSDALRVVRAITVRDGSTAERASPGCAAQPPDSAAASRGG